MAGLTPGDLAPDFTLPRDGGGTIALSALRGRPVVLFFYPKDDTKSCTLEAISFTELAPEFAAAGVELIGISPDSVKRHDRFAKKHDLAVTLAADEEKSVINAYGLWVEKSLYGRKYMGVERSTFLIATDGRIARVWEKVKVNGHANEVLEAAKEL
ncbi:MULTISPECIES: peroxiredoxin [unclassified Ensifer]|uniref:peroxiredoxin n=1 Tax=unclassified Ensifer TaxID=2633371 RepID=UPI000812DE12|nr:MULTISPECIES: peroxiredoxin [unclassified Ensifer]OCP18986.1 peroxiredoxin [Ensifer sp. LC384]OCP28024.1 peroxiredoxin [Ensifer sp. LC54]